LYGVFDSTGFAQVFPEKRLELKTLKGKTKAEEERTSRPFLVRLRLSLKALKFEPFLRKNSGKMAEPRGHRGGTDPLLKYTPHYILVLSSVRKVYLSQNISARLSS
jgi:hypothetical protein